MLTKSQFVAALAVAIAAAACSGCLMDPSEAGNLVPRNGTVNYLLRKFGQECLVVRVFPQAVGQQLHRLGRLERRQRSPQQRDLAVFLGVEDLLFFAGAAACNIKGRKNPSV